MLSQEIKRQLPKVEIFYFGLPQSEEVTLSNYVEIKKNGLHHAIRVKRIDVLFINYSNYGYQKKGVPVWLIKQAALIKAMGVNIITFFHELYASGKVWQSAFWLNLVQKKLYQNLYRQSSSVFCSNGFVLNILKKTTNDKGNKAKNIGIFSNIPEPVILLPWVDRDNTAVVFGTYARRLAIYKKITLVKEFSKRVKIETIIDIGAGDLTKQWQRLGMRVIPKGQLSNSEIGNLLASAKWGLIEYHTGLLGKSGIFAAYACYGIVPVMFRNDQIPTCDALELGKHFVQSNSTHFDDTVSLNIYNWYNEHNLFIHTSGIINGLPLLMANEQYIQRQ